MNTQMRPLDTRTFRIAAIAVAAVIVLGLAAYFFGTGLRADTSASVAPSPLGSSLTAVREKAASSADYASFGLPVFAAARSTSAGSSTLDYASLGLPAAAASSLAGMPAAEYAARTGIPAASVTMPESVRAKADVLQSIAPQGMKASGAADLASDPSTWIKPEGIKPGVVVAAPGQYQWIKPEGIRPASGFGDEQLQ